MSLRYALLVALAALLPLQAAASCAFIRDGKTTPSIQVLDHWSARHVNDGKVNGCLLKVREIDDGKEYVAYTAYDFMCALGAGETLAVQRAYACCDTGEQGDYVCGIKPINPLAMLGQTNVGLMPAKPDRRAIPNLMDRLADAEWVGVRNITERLAEYAVEPTLQEDIRALRPRLRDIMDGAKNPQKKAAIAALLLQLSQNDEKQPDDLALVLTLLGGAGQWQELTTGEIAALDVAKRHPEAAEQIVPVLVELLRRGQHREPTKTLLLDTMPVFGAALQPHLLQIYALLGDDLFSRGTVDAAIAEDALKFDWFKANNRDRNNPDEQRRYAAEQMRQREDLEARFQRSLKIMPLWEKLVCAAFPVAAGTATRVVWDETIWSRDGRITSVNCPP